VKVGEEELQRLYEFDLTVLDDLSALERELAAVPDPGQTDPSAAVDQAVQHARALEDKWKQRELVISNIVQSGSGA
jgi:hypothetical protein